MTYPLETGLLGEAPLLSRFETQPSGSAALHLATIYLTTATIEAVISR